MKVLVVVEDDPDMRVLLRALLEREPRLDLVGEAATAEEAVELAGAHQPDIIVLDHFLAGDVHGLQVAPQLKRVAPEARILLLSSHDLRIEAGREPAVDAFVRKERLDQLLPTVRRLVGLPAGAGGG
jgi:DNA-binding NarL/FixJ family response regulator